MGVEDNQFTITNLASNTSFFDWFTKENDDIINKLNRLKLYDVDVTGSAAQGISADVGTTGSGITAGFIQLGVYPTIPHGITVSGDLAVTGKIVGSSKNVGFDFAHSTTAVTSGIAAGKFVVPDSTGGLTLSSAQSGATSYGFDKNSTIGVVESITNNTFRIIGSGVFGSFSGLTAGQVYYLDSEVDGGYTMNKTTTDEQTILKLFISSSTTEGIIQMGDSTIN